MSTHFSEEYAESAIDYRRVFEQKRGQLARAIEALGTDPIHDGLFAHQEGALTIPVDPVNGEGDVELWLVVGEGVEVYQIVPSEDGGSPGTQELVGGDSLKDCNTLGRIVNAVRDRAPNSSSGPISFG